MKETGYIAAIDIADGKTIEVFRQIEKGKWVHLKDVVISVQNGFRDFAITTMVNTPIDAKRTAYGYSVVTSGYQRQPKKRSSRGIKVQDKRKALGLSVWGKYSEGAYASLSRKEAYTRALQTVRVQLLCQECSTWFTLTVRRVEVNSYWYKSLSILEVG